jgi:hypothetical protein
VISEDNCAPVIAMCIIAMMLAVLRRERAPRMRAPTETANRSKPARIAPSPRRVLSRARRVRRAGIAQTIHDYECGRARIPAQRLRSLRGRCDARCAIFSGRRARAGAELADRAGAKAGNNFLDSQCVSIAIEPGEDVGAAGTASGDIITFFHTFAHRVSRAITHEANEFGPPISLRCKGESAYFNEARLPPSGRRPQLACGTRFDATPLRL